MAKLRAGIVGATGMVGQRFVTLLDNHPYFEITALAASARSAGKTYIEAVGERWKLEEPMPECVKNMTIFDASDIDAIKPHVDFVFCAVDMKKDEIRALEEAYAKKEIPVVSNNSAHRWTEDVPMLIPEINDGHAKIIESQKKRLGTKKGFISVKPNCSIQSYVPLITPLLDFEPTEIVVTTFQAISGAGKTFKDWPEILDNVIPYIGGEEEKSEQEPLKVWGKIRCGKIHNAKGPKITAQCIRVPASNGHLAAVYIRFKNKPSKEEILKRWKEFSGKPQELGLPHAPKQFITYFEEDNRPQTALDRMIEGGMGISAGRLREDSVYDYKFIGLSHNTLRGAAGGAVLSAELLYREGYLG
ncbi:MAG: aspartate-semialdehyde dehydrogenase [Ruminococcaceae bacterium]|nr:aspartate-semialdehyde dehydrogenase [Oscillospiraceae bacterium]